MMRTGVILAGGFGTRLSAAVPGKAKCVAEVNGRPFLVFPLAQMARAGLERVILCTGYRSEQVRDEIGDRFEGVSLLYSVEEQPLGTGGAVREAWRRYGGDEPWLVMNGDSFVDLDLAELADAHGRRGLDATITAVEVEDGRRFGGIEWDAEGRITAFREKRDAPGPRWINGGVYVFAPRFLAGLPGHSPLSLETEVFPAAIAGGIGVFARPARFIDIGTPESYELAQRFFAAGGAYPQTIRSA